MNQVVLFIQLLTICQLTDGYSKGKVFNVQSTHCLNSSLSVWRTQPSPSLRHCFVSSRSFGLQSVGVVQRNRRDASCALFRFSLVCHLLGLSSLSGVPGSIKAAAERDCEMVVDSEYDAVTANRHFHAVWVGDRGPALENVVCGSDGQRNPMRSSGVTWTNEGAGMDGTSSKLWVNETDGIMYYNSSYTWVIHLKRKPKSNCFIEMFTCGTSDIKDHFWEYSADGSVRSMYFHPYETYLYDTGTLLTTDPNEFFIAGVAYARDLLDCNFFLGTSFVSSPTRRHSVPDYPIESSVCLKIGWRVASSGSGMLSGVVRAVAIANTALSDVAIRSLFLNP